MLNTFVPIKEYVTNYKALLQKTITNLSEPLELMIIQVGHNQASDTYIRNKVKDAEEVGLKCTVINFDETITETDLLAFIDTANNDNSINGIIVQLPLPKHISEESIKLAIMPEKDVDGFHPLSKTVAATPLGIYKYLKAMQYDFDDDNKNKDRCDKRSERYPLRALLDRHDCPPPVLPTTLTEN